MAGNKDDRDYFYITLQCDNRPHCYNLETTEDGFYEGSSCPKCNKGKMKSTGLMIYPNRRKEAERLGFADDPEFYDPDW